MTINIDDLRHLSVLFTEPEGEAILTTNILRQWDREKIERFATHLLGDQAQSLLTYVTCGCGDIRYRGDMCHLKNHCQLGCCDCIPSEEANALREEVRKLKKG